MAEAAARSSLRAAATETRVHACGEAIFEMVKIDDQHSPCSVRVHGPLIIYHESRKIGDTRSRSVHEEVPSYERLFDCRMEVQDPSIFLSYVACRDLIQKMLAQGPETCKCDLAPDNWDDYRPHEFATAIVANVRRETEDACGVVPSYAIDIEILLNVRLIYREPRALLLACKDAAETVAARVSAGRKRRREPAAREMCAICLLDFLETEEEETVRLPCSHAFHGRCIEPWFHHVSTCPTCRRDAANSTAVIDEVELETAEGSNDGPPVQVDSTQHDAIVDELGLETGEGNDDGPPIQVDRPVRARRHYLWIR